MAMTDDPTDLSQRNPAAPAPEPALSWAESEVLSALRRLARAQAELAAVETSSSSGRAAAFAPVDVARLEQAHAELGAARAKASGRFSKGAARHRVRDLEAAEQAALDRLGVATYDDYQARLAGLAPATDPAVVDFARRELDSAQQAWREVQSLPVEPTAGSAGSVPEIDLTSPSPPRDPGVV